MLAVAGISFFARLISGNFKKAGVSLAITGVMAMVLLLAAMVSGASWLSVAGNKGLRQLRDAAESHIMVNDKRVHVDFAPFRVDVKVDK
ncbi:hypothetical protein FWF48_02065 [Candidatus Saccharibacteria bacterium]|nr:hypothetical protein [Candidatus Saccharibacteria bacterium]